MRFTKLVLFPLILALIGLNAGLAGATAPTRAAPESPLAPSAAPFLSIPDNVPGQPGATVSLPVTFSYGGENVSSVVFSVDYDHTRLAFDPADNNSDGLPDAVAFDIHPLDPSKGGFSTQITYDPGDPDGELDIAIADYATPLASLSGGVIVTVRLVVLPGPVPQTAAVNFSGSPQASFGGVSGQSITGFTDNGSVLISAPVATTTVPPTEPPTATATPPPPAATATPTAIVLPPVPMRVYLPFSLRSFPVLYSISGRVVDRFNAPVSGVTVSAGGGRTAATDGSGSFTLTGLPAGTYILTPSKTNTTFSPVSRTITVPPDASGANFTAEPVLVLPPPGNCSEALSNGGFENAGAWVRSKAPYSTALFHSGARSLLTGNLDLNDNEADPSYTYQQAYIPANAKTVTLRFWEYSSSSETNSQSSDSQYAYLICTGTGEKTTFLSQLSNARSWVFREFAVPSRNFGQTVNLYFGSANDGRGGVTSMFVDDVSLQVCK